MTTPARSIRPKCPECGFSIFNRRFAKCESCGAQLPISIIYTENELKLLRKNEKAEEEAGQIARARLSRDSDGGLFTGDGGWSDGVGGWGDGGGGDGG
jgi:hypothetical protein